eukprot:scaffold13761_cov74-Cyclotella_meneghiniana.AAC.13
MLSVVRVTLAVDRCGETSPIHLLGFAQKLDIDENPYVKIGRPYGISTTPSPQTKPFVAVTSGWTHWASHCNKGLGLRACGCLLMPAQLGGTHLKSNVL